MTATALAALTIWAGESLAAPTLSVSATVRVDSPGSKIDRHLYGQFAEHLGRDIYDGLWVGENSPIPNTHGYRNDVIDALKALHIPVIRWPGGCFADEYHWRDGIGPREQRPVRVNTRWGGVEESNAFGTHEFLDFAELIGADAYLAGDIGSGSPQEMAEWVEYITSDTHSALAELRRKNGRDKPWRLPYFGVGNETWGCGGNMRPQYYADLFRRYATFLDAPKGNPLVRVASGSHDDDYNWTEVLMSQATASTDAISLHYYTIPSGQWKHKGAATGFGENEWSATLKAASRIDEIITRHSAIMDRYDPQKRVGLFVDEWGTWYDPLDARQSMGILYQQNTLRDALVAALTLDIFHRHADRVRMANIAQMVNVLQAMILTQRDKMVLTPTYHVFKMYIPFQDAIALPVEVQAPPYEQGGTKLPSVDMSAARDSSGRIQLALVNLDPHHAASVSLEVVGTSVRTATGQVLTATDMDTHNTFDHPDQIRPAPFTAHAQVGRILLDLPSKSVVVVAVE